MLQLPAIPQHPGNQFTWGQLYGSAKALAIAEAASQFKGLSLVIVDSAQEAWQLEASIKFFLGKRALPILHYPDWETLPYDIYSPHQDIISERLSTLYQLPQIKQGLLILPAISLLQRVPPTGYLEQQAFIAKTGDTLDINALRARLERAGYSCVSQVLEHGEFAVRGSLVDLFPMGHDHPYRIDLFDDEIESIRDFDPETQRSENKHQEIRLLPAREFPLNADAITEFRGRWRNRFSGDPQSCVVYRDVSNGLAPAGVEYYLPLFFDATASLFDYLPQQTLVLQTSSADVANEHFWEQLAQRHEQRRHNTERPILEPDELYLRPQASKEALAAYPHIQLQNHEAAETLTNKYNFAAQKPGSFQLQVKESDPSARLRTFIEDCDKAVLFVAESAGRRESLLELLRGINVHASKYKTGMRLMRISHITLV